MILLLLVFDGLRFKRPFFLCSEERLAIVWVKKGSSASFYCKVPSLVSRMSSFYKSLVEQGPTTQQPTKVCFSFSTGGTQHSIPVLVLSRMFATQCSHDPLVADYVDIILFDAQFSKASEENYPR